MECHAAEQGTLLKAVFGPGSDWATRAARAFGVKCRMIYWLSGGRRRMTRRQWIIVTTIGRQRPYNIRAEKRRELARIEREYERAAHEAERLSRYAEKMVVEIDRAAGRQR